MNQLLNLSTQLPTGEMGNSIQSPRTDILMQLEHNRRQYNRINNEQLDLYTFIHMIGDPTKANGMRYLNHNALETLYFLIITEIKQNNYLSKAKYFNNKKTRL